MKPHDENFEICQRYCISHVVHHTYPFVNKSTVKNSIEGYVSRFYGHGYFKVCRELQNQVKKYLNNESVFEKNPQVRLIIGNYYTSKLTCIHINLININYSMIYNGVY